MNRAITITTGSGAANHQGKRIPVTVEQFARQLCEYAPGRSRHDKLHTGSKIDSPWVSPSVYRDDYLNRDGFEAAYGAVLDHDAGTLDRAKIDAALAGLCYIVYTSYSHSEGKPKYRIIILLDQPVTDAAHYTAIIDSLTARFEGHEFDAKSRQPYGLWFIGSINPKSKGSYQAWHVDGEPFAVGSVSAQSAATVSQDKGKTIPDADEAVLERAAAWLATQEPGAPGNRNETAYRAACMLRDFGCSEQQAHELMAEWDVGDAPVNPITSAFRYATGDAGAKAVRAADFPLIEDSPAPGNPVAEDEFKPVFDVTGRTRPKEQRRRHTGGSAHEWASRLTTGQNYLVKNLLMRGSYSMIYADAKSGKSFIAFDLSYHIAANKPWWDHKVSGGPVLYLAFEGKAGIPVRMAALEQHYGNLDGVPLHIEPASWNLLDKNERRAFAARLAEIIRTQFNGQAPAMIVFDTLARAIPGTDENTAKDMGLFNRVVEQLIDATGAGCLVIHHKNKAGGYRGSSAIPAAVESMIEVEDGIITSELQRDMESGARLGFKLCPIAVGMDDDGDAITSCVVERTSAPLLKRKLTEQQQTLMTVIADLSPTNEAIDTEAFKAEFRDRQWPGEDEVDPDSVKRAFNRHTKRLIEMKLIEKVDNGWRRRFMEPTPAAPPATRPEPSTTDESDTVTAASGSADESAPEAPEAKPQPQQKKRTPERVTELLSTVQDLKGTVGPNGKVYSRAALLAIAEQREREAAERAFE